MKKSKRIANYFEDRAAKIAIIFLALVASIEILIVGATILAKIPPSFEPHCVALFDVLMIALSVLFLISVPAAIVIYMIWLWRNTP